MKISEIFSKKKQSFSFEFFPPKTPEAEEQLYAAAAELKVLKPTFVSVTYGAMGSTRSNTIRIADHIKSKLGLEVASHLTCVGNTKQEIESVLRELKAKGIQSVVALRGDPPKGETEFKPVAGGFRYASELVAFIRGHEEFRDWFSIAVAGYPEKHPESVSLEQDWKHLSLKVKEGADAVVTQLFFSNGDFFRFEEGCRKLGIQVPLVAGIMPITNGKQIERFSQMCGASIPQPIHAAIQRFGDDNESVTAFGIDYASRQCEELIRHGVAGIHFYTLNKSRATAEIYKNLGLHKFNA